MADRSQEWLRETLGRALGPEWEKLGAIPTEVFRKAFLDPANQQVTSESKFARFRGTITDKTTEVFQVVPTGYYDTAIITVKETQRKTRLIRYLGYLVRFCQKAE
jgi:hypothetical protein